MEKTGGNLEIEGFSIDCRKIKTVVSTTANQSRENTCQSQGELKVKTSKLPKARENTGDQVVSGFSFAPDWLRE